MTTGNAMRFHSLRESLSELVESSGLVALKTGTEVEDMGFEDIKILRELSRDIIPLYVKIGGPEARNDIRELNAIGVDGIIAPMIESPYALHKFVFTMREVLGERYSQIEKGINLETILGFNQMNEILSSPDARELVQITAARTDLSGSMNLKPDHERVLEICSVIAARARENDIRTSVGGAIHPGIIEDLMGQVNSDTVNTRHMVLSCAAIRVQSARKVQNNLEFEASLYDWLATMPTARSSSYANRASIIRGRIQAVKVQQTL